MRTLRRVLSSGLVAAMLLVAAPAASFALAFSDVRPGVTPYATAIEALKGRGVLSGYSDGTYRPSLTVNRAEFLKIILESRGGTFAGADCFPDVRDEWFAPYVCAAKGEDIVDGYPDGTFKPEKTISFVEAAKILALAYGQDVQNAGDWYTGYAKALESSKAIPRSITGLEKPLTRGEMAEMMWRLTEGKTDQPAKAYMNVKYPALSLDIAANPDKPQAVKSCADLAAFAEEGQRSGGMWARKGMLMEQGAVPTAVMAPSQTAGGDQARDYSQTNVQVEGVDEADIVKTDGAYLYAVENGIIRIIRADPASAMAVLSLIDLSGSAFSASELYVDGDRLVVTGSRWKEQPYSIMQKIAPGMYPYPSGRQRTEVRIYDVSDRANPRLARELSFDGSLVSSRRIDDRLYLVMNQNMPWVGPQPLYREENVLPTYSDSALGGQDRPVGRCGDVTILPRVPDPAYLIVSVVPLSNTSGEVKKEVVVGSAQGLYVSMQNLYVAANEWTYFWRDGTGSSTEQTHLYRFALTEDGVSFAAKGVVPGRILNQFSMDEHEQTFRVATTQGQSWDTAHPSTNNLLVLNMNLEKVGEITGIAPGENIYSVRFMGDRTYMVTFKKIDPFFVIDTSDPRNPRILGKLKVPGYSDYLHPYDETHILGFGKDAEDAKQGDFAWYQGMKVALFDVTDPANPVEMSKVIIGDRGTDSPLLSNHKALLFDKSRNLLAFPVKVAEVSESMKEQGSWDFPAYGETTFQGAYVYDISLGGGLQYRGRITHYGADDVLKAGSYLYGKDVERVVRIGDSLFTVGQDRVVRSTEKSLTEEGSVIF